MILRPAAEVGYCMTFQQTSGTLSLSSGMTIVVVFKFTPFGNSAGRNFIFPTRQLSWSQSFTSQSFTSTPSPPGGSQTRKCVNLSTAGSGYGV